MDWKNASLITKEYGPRLRLVTILTYAQLLCNEPFEGDYCGNCTACQEACPSGAILGASFKATDSLEKRFIGERCDVHLSKVRNTFEKRICGKCLSVCPHGR
ncbi:hypothetical protein AZF37_00800 [endosymbiont 'TC1' of Trimyema compressum]|uniref:4Fe-4S double cluster binding domain-containing protein n=1 Tax=endosymbiont 'TC1' of Trimyema compressum TaxID=243899 RepID=UPI0007F14334|nr:4Fe-4S double cluster binding domain-containing protein [endosymbiont 'TC1' of Trimyema compressum]AMP19910.1 hypothetical protein AZF37_00800 [endosymbiont 'TC1' of Trimyema compressum]